jgi:hypothetical protein
VIGIVTTTTGAVGVLVLEAMTKINDWNLYSGSLGLIPVRSPAAAVAEA